MTATILIVEDDAAFAYAVRRHLEGHNYRTLTAASSSEALEKFESEPIDLVITDIRLLQGEPQGLALARSIRARQPEIPLILVTAYPELLAGEAPPGIVFHKPLELATLQSAVSACLGNAERA
jgi:CheY-like chemotaxis protein